jgi:hypothetical protein
MTDEPWGARSSSPVEEGSEETTDGAGGGGEQRAGEDPGEQRPRENKGSPAQPWSADEQRYGDTAEQAGQPNLSRDPPASEQRTRGEPTDATPS